jgi:hypothetical protein
MAIKIIKESDIIRLPGLLPARVGIAKRGKEYLTFTARVRGDTEEPIESSMQPAPNMTVAQKQYTARIRILEGL